MRFAIECTGGTPDSVFPDRVRAIARESGSFKQPGSGNPPVYATDLHHHWAIEIESLSDLLALSKRCGSPLIIKEPSNIGSGIRPGGWPAFKDELPEIEIYNDYRE